MNDGEAAALFSTARVARLGTVDGAGNPHLVPVVFAVEDGRIFTAVDHKPKRTTALRRLDNIRANPVVSLLVDHYDDEDWTALWWVRADGRARVLDATDAVARHGVDLLADRYPQHREHPPDGPVVVVDVGRWIGWSAGP